MSIINDLQSIGKILQKAGNIELYEKLLTIQENALEFREKTLISKRNASVQRNSDIA